MQKSIEQGRDRGRVAKDLSPVLDRSVGGQDRAGPLVAAHDDLEQILGGVGRELAHPEVVDDEQLDPLKIGHVLLAALIERRIHQLLDQRVGLAIVDLMALGDGSVADGLNEVTLACAR